MAATPSSMLPLGTALPAFDLPDTVTGRNMTQRDARGAKGTLVMFICNHCPFVLHVLDELQRVAHEAMDRDFGVVAISANDADAYPQDAPGPMKAMAEGRAWRFPYLHDASQQVARAFDAACTPDLYLFDAAGHLAYRGRLDDSRPGAPAPVTGADLRAALDAVEAGRAPSADQKPSIGCNIKWKAAAS